MSEYCRSGLHLRIPENLYPSGTCKLCATVSRQKRLGTKHAQLLAVIERDGFAVCPNGHRMTVKTMDFGGRCLICRSVRYAETRPPKPPKPPRTHCRHGHLLAEVGMLRTGSCRLCHNISSNRRYHKASRDPKWRANLNERQKFTSEKARRAKGVVPRKWRADSPRGKQFSVERKTVPTAPFVAWLASYLAGNPDESAAKLCARIGISDRIVSQIRSARSVKLSTVAKFLDGAGCSLELHALYPLKDGAEIEPTEYLVPRERLYCRFGGCTQSNGHGHLGNFCEAHAAQFERWRREFEGEGVLRAFGDDDLLGAYEQAT